MFTADLVTSTVQMVVVHLSFNAKNSAGLTWLKDTGNVDWICAFYNLCSAYLALSTFIGNSTSLMQCRST